MVSDASCVLQPQKTIPSNNRGVKITATLGAYSFMVFILDGCPNKNTTCAVFNAPSYAVSAVF